jgi:hypothetical protein
MSDDGRQGPFCSSVSPSAVWRQVAAAIKGAGGGLEEDIDGASAANTPPLPLPPPHSSLLSTVPPTPSTTHPPVCMSICHILPNTLLRLLHCCRRRLLLRLCLHLLLLRRRHLHKTHTQTLTLNPLQNPHPNPEPRTLLRGGHVRAARDAQDGQKVDEDAQEACARGKPCARRVRPPCEQGSHGLVRVGSRERRSEGGGWG